jgi:hypothetical protein
MLFTAEDVIQGNPEDENNSFQWDQVKMNLPGDPSYDLSLPWVYKVKKDGTPAADFFFYVDDNRTPGNSEGEAWKATHRVARPASAVTLAFRMPLGNGRKPLKCWELGRAQSCLPTSKVSTLPYPRENGTRPKQ